MSGPPPSEAPRRAEPKRANGHAWEAHADRRMLVCPSCQGSLQDEVGWFACQRCAAVYHDRGGFPCFLPHGSVASFGAQWEFHRAGALGTPGRIYGLEERDHFQFVLASSAMSERGVRGLRVLDAGTGHGCLARCFAKEGAQVWATDLTPAGFTPPGHQGPAFILADYSFMPFRPGSFDLVISAGVIHHCENPWLALASIARYVAKKGTLYLYAYEPGKVGYLALRRWAPGARYLSPRNLLRLAKVLSGPLQLLLSLRRRRWVARGDVQLGIFDALSPKHCFQMSPGAVLSELQALGFAVVEHVGSCVYRATR